MERSREGKAERILVINDTQYILELFRDILESEGYEVVLSSYPAQRVQEIEQVRPDLIILDFLFEGRAMGWQMVQQLSMYRGTAKIPVIICTAAVQEVREQEGYLVSQGIGIVYKPFDVDQLLESVQKALQRRGKTMRDTEAKE